VRFDLSREFEAEYSSYQIQQQFENTVPRGIFGCTKDEAGGRKLREEGL
jgi:hypothetical protein